MSRFLYLIAIVMLPVLSAGGGVPRKTPWKVYEELCTQSPFTVERESVPDERPRENPFEDWALGGVAGVGEGWVVGGGIGCWIEAVPGRWMAGGDG